MLFDVLFVVVDTLILGPLGALPLPEWSVSDNFLGILRALYRKMDIVVNMPLILSGLRAFMFAAMILIPVRLTMMVYKMIRG